jgi:hypothetical protein
MDSSNWKTTWQNITGLELDQKNPRLPGVGGNKSTRDIVAVLIEHEDLLGLAKSIVDFRGLYPSERLIIVEENTEKIVVEGNRRLAALKLLHSPDLAPPQYVERFRHLSNKIGPQAIQKVEVVLAPSRSAAARLIVARHAGDSLRRWSTAQQARFIRTLVDGNLTIEEAAQEIQMSPGDVRDYLRTDTMIRLALVMPLENRVREKLEEHDGFPVAPLQRLIQSSEGQRFLGITFDSDGNSVGNLDVDEFKKGYTKIITDIAKGDVNTRKLNKSGDIKKYLRKLKAATPDKSKKGTWTSTALLSGSTEQAKKAIRAATRTNRSKARTDAYLIARGFSCELNSPRIVEIFGELRRLKLSEFPNACAVLVRIFVELVVAYNLDKTGKSAPLYAKAQKDGKGQDWAPTLRQMMRIVLQDGDLKLRALNRKALNRMVNNDESLLSLEHIDQFVHNDYIAPNQRDLRMLWNTLEPFMSQYVQEPATPAP